MFTGGAPSCSLWLCPSHNSLMPHYLHSVLHLNSLNTSILVSSSNVHGHTRAKDKPYPPFLPALPSRSTNISLYIGRLNTDLAANYISRTLERAAKPCGAAVAFIQCNINPLDNLSDLPALTLLNCYCWRIKACRLNLLSESFDASDLVDHGEGAERQLSIYILGIRITLNIFQIILHSWKVFKML